MIGVVGWVVEDTFVFFFFFNDTATTEIYTLSLHDALPIWVDAIKTRMFGSSAVGGLKDRAGIANVGAWPQH